jgi:hypothetical protein
MLLEVNVRESAGFSSVFVTVTLADAAEVATTPKAAVATASSIILLNMNVPF